MRVIMRPQPAPLPSARPRPALGASPKTWCAECQSAPPTVPPHPGFPLSTQAASQPHMVLGAQPRDKIPAVGETHGHSRPHTSAHAFCPDFPHASASAPRVPRLLRHCPDLTMERGPGRMAGSRHSRRRGRRGGAVLAVGPASPLTAAWQRFPRPLPSKKVYGSWAIAPRCWGLLYKGDVGSSAGAFGKRAAIAAQERRQRRRGERWNLHPIPKP